MSAISYRPSLWYRVCDLCAIVWHVLTLRDHTEPVAAEGTAVLVLDVIEPYRELWSDERTAHLTRLLKAARRAQCPIIFTRWARTRECPLDVIAAKGHWSEFLPSSDNQLIFGPYDDGDKVLPGEHTNAFAHKCVRDALRGCKTVVVTGMWTESCVRSTVAAAAERNVFPIVVAPCCAGHGLDHTYALCTMQALHASVVSDVVFS